MIWHFVIRQIGSHYWDSISPN